ILNKKNVLFKGGKYMNEILKYHSNEIKEIQNQYDFKKAVMSGYYNDLSKLKVKLEEMYNDNISYLDYGLWEAPYHGWSAEELKDMREHAKEIKRKFKELYALVLLGIGEKIE